MKTIIATAGFVGLLLVFVSWASGQGVMKCYDAAGPANYPFVTCSGGIVSQQNVYPVLAATDTAQCITIPAAEADYTLPAHDAFEFCAHGTAAFILCAAAAPVAATTAVGGYAWRVEAGQCIGPYEMTGVTVCSVIGTASPAGNSLCIHGLDYN